MAVDALGEDVERLFQGARRVARRAGHARVDAAHVLLAALEPVPDELRGALAAARVGIVELRDRLERQLAELPRGQPGDALEIVELGDGLVPVLRSAGERAAGYCRSASQNAQLWSTANVVSAAGLGGTSAWTLSVLVSNAVHGGVVSAVGWPVRANVAQ